MLKKKALITGITGMVGCHLADFLLANYRLGYLRYVPLAKSSG